MSALAFELPTRLQATEPPEHRGLARDGVRLMVADRDGSPLCNARFHELPQLLHPHDLLVVNVSATLPASVSGRRAGDRLTDDTDARTFAGGSDDDVLHSDPGPKFALATM